MKVGVGTSELPDSELAGIEAFRRAIGQSGGAVLAVVFITSAYDPVLILDALRNEPGASRLVGFSCAGILTDQRVLSQGVGVCTLNGDFRAMTSLQTDLQHNAYEAGVRAGEVVVSADMQTGTVFVLPDGFQADLAGVLRGLYARLGADFRYIGGGAGDAQAFETFQFTEEGVATNAVAVAALEHAAVSSAIGHGWRPIGPPLILTKVRGNLRVTTSDS